MISGLTYDDSKPANNSDLSTHVSAWVQTSLICWSALTCHPGLRLADLLRLCLPDLLLDLRRLLDFPGANELTGGKSGRLRNSPKSSGGTLYNSIRGLLGA